MRKTTLLFAMMLLLAHCPLLPAWASVPATVSPLMEEAMTLASDDEAVAVGKLRDAIQWAQKNDDESQLQAAIDQFKADNADQEKDETSKVGTDKESWNVGTRNNSQRDTYHHNGVTLVEHFGETAVGIMLSQEVNVVNGTYNIEVYATSHNAWNGGYMPISDDNPAPSLQTDANDVAYVFGASAGIAVQTWITARCNSSMLDFEPETYAINGVEVSDGKLLIGLALAKAGQTEWHTIQIKSLKWVATAKNIYASVQAELAALVAEARALEADAYKPNRKEAFSAAIEDAAIAVNSNWYNIPEVEEIIDNLREAISLFKKANYYIDLSVGEYYIIDAESGLMMEAGGDWGVRGIVGKMGLDLILTPDETTRSVSINTRINNGGYKNYLGSNLYMDADEYGWFLEYRGSGFYITNGDGQYINIGDDKNLVSSNTPREWIIASKESVMQQRMEELAEATESNPKDATFLLQNPAFNRNDLRTEAWEVSDECTDYKLGGPFWTNMENYCGEAYHCAFTISQTIAGAPVGLYLLTAQGFYRQDDGATEDAPRFFIGNETADLPVIAGTENTMAEAATSFAAGLYTTEPITFFYDGYGDMAVGIEGTAIHQWVAFDNFCLTYLGEPNTTEDHECVDLGLPSGTLWATCNIGAYNPEEYGDYFAWGETKQKESYSWDTYKYCYGTGETLTKYCSDMLYGNDGFVDNLTELLPEDDAATVNWGEEWTMPSKEQIEELLNSSYTTAEVTTLNGVEGYKITSNTNGESIFLPAAGFYELGGVQSRGIKGDYWSRSLYSRTDGGYSLFFRTDMEDRVTLYASERYYGRTIRPVRTKEVYTEFVESEGTLTYYYDNQRAKRSGETELFDPIKYPDAVRFADYYKKVTKVAIDPSMKQAPLTSFRNMSYGGANEETFEFYVLQNVTSIEGLENLNTEIVTDMNSMFIMCSSLEELDLSSFNTSNVTNMNGMFMGCAKLQTLDLSSFDINNVTDMRMMFGSCRELTTIVCDEDWSKVVPADNMYVMFSGCYKLVGGKGTPFDSDVINGTYARPDEGEGKPGYFTKREVYTEFAEETGTLTYRYDGLYASCEGPTEFYDPVNNSNAARFADYHDKVLKVVIAPSMKQAPLTSTENMFTGYYDSENKEFYELTEMTSIEGMENLNTSQVTSMHHMFYGCAKLAELDLSSWNTSNVEIMSYLFRECKSLTSVNLSSFNTTNVKNMDGMFYDCEALKTVDLSMFNTSKVTSMNNMFGLCKSLETLDLSSFDTREVVDMSSMFKFCTSLQTLDLSSFDTKKAEYMSAMFSDCDNLQVIDITSFDIRRVVGMDNMFSWCPLLTTICCFGDWTTSTASDNDMFDGCESLVGGMGTTYNDEVKDKSYARRDGGEASPGYFTEETITGIRSIDNRQRTTDESIYNLSGQRLNKMQRGINIVGGKKIAVGK